MAGFGSTGDRAFASKDGRTAYVYVFPPRSDDPFGGNVDAQRDLREALRGRRGRRAPRCRLTGYDALYDSSGEADEGPGRPARGRDRRLRRADRARLRVRLLLALVPLAMAICSILVSFLLLWGLTAITDVSPIVQFLVALIGLGVSIDYALLIVVRWREEREKGLDERGRGRRRDGHRRAVPWSSRARRSRSACWP